MTVSIGFRIYIYTYINIYRYIYIYISVATNWIFWLSSEFRIFKKKKNWRIEYSSKMVWEKKLVSSESEDVGPVHERIFGKNLKKKKSVERIRIGDPKKKKICLERIPKVFAILRES